MRILGAGDNTADRYVNRGVLYPGGNALNVAVFAARLGVHAGYLGVVGNDEVGQHILASLRAERVDTALVRVGDGPNATADVELHDNDRVFLRSDRTTAQFELDDGQLAAMAGYDVVHTGYAGTLLPRVAEIAERSRVSFDFGSRYEFDRVEPTLPHLHLAAFSGGHLSADEAVSLCRAALTAGAENVLVTRGSDGAYFATEGRVVHQPADRVSAVDTLGAGDAFITGVLVGLGTGRSTDALLASASAYASQVCQVDGAFGHGMPFDASSIRSSAATASSSPDPVAAEPTGESDTNRKRAVEA